MWRSREVKAPAARAVLRGEVKLNARSGSSDSIVQANLLVPEGCLHNDAFKAYKTHFQVLWTEWRPGCGRLSERLDNRVL